MENVWSGVAPDIQELLAQLEAHDRPMPLVSSRRVDRKAAEILNGASKFFSSSQHPDGALAGLWLLAGDWEKAHEIAQDLPTAEGSYWHAIVHRMEPDDWNSGYWFRRVGVHPVFADLQAKASELTKTAGLRWSAGERWDPVRFIEFCEQARRSPGSAEETLAEEIQRAEWKLLFRWCAQGA